MEKIRLIIWREFITRVRKPSFIIMSLLGPLLIAGSVTLLIYLSVQETTDHLVYVVDGPGILDGKLKEKSSLHFVYGTDVLSDSAFKDGPYTLMAQVFPNINDPAVHLFYKEPPGILVQRYISVEIEKVFEQVKIVQKGIDPEAYASIKKPVTITTFDIEDTENESNTEALGVIGFFLGYIMFFFIFMYAVQVMRGVMEEKSNRIVEVLISSVKPFQLMMGKIIGIAMVGFTQFMLWVALSTVIIVIGVATLMGTGNFDTEGIADQVQMTTEMQEQMTGGAGGGDMSPEKMESMIGVFDSINIPVTLLLFLFYFIGGYLLYSSLFAAVGSAVDNETDTQQFMMPVMIPLIVAIFIAQMAMTNPSSPFVVWGSIIPFTSPIVMMTRIVLGDVFNTPWHLVASMAMMIAGFLFTTWIAGKIYRIGILMYGKKVNYKELLKWLRYS
jgi:ABC-2 type transport system permease protein